MLLTTEEHDEAPAVKLEEYLDKTHGEIAPVYEVQKIHDKRIENGEIFYNSKQTKKNPPYIQKDLRLWLN